MSVMYWTRLLKGVAEPGPPVDRCSQSSKIHRLTFHCVAWARARYRRSAPGRLSVHDCADPPSERCEREPGPLVGYLRPGLGGPSSRPVTPQCVCCLHAFYRFPGSETRPGAMPFLPIHAVEADVGMFAVSVAVLAQPRVVLFANADRFAYAFSGARARVHGVTINYGPRGQPSPDWSRPRVVQGLHREPTRGELPCAASGRDICSVSDVPLGSDRRGRYSPWMVVSVALRS